MSRFVIFTNNPAVNATYPDCAYYRQENNVYQIFVAVRDAIHTGARIVSHPLSGSVKPNNNPYKSVVLSNHDHAPNSLDFKSLRIIEDAIATLKKLPVKHIDFSEAVLEDFRVIDLELINSAMAALPAGE